MIIYILTDIFVSPNGKLMSLDRNIEINGIAIAADNHAYFAVITEKQKI